jgi:hypothetical protein
MNQIPCPKCGLKLLEQESLFGLIKCRGCHALWNEDDLFHQLARFKKNYPIRDENPIHH